MKLFSHIYRYNLTNDMSTDHLNSLLVFYISLLLLLLLLLYVNNKNIRRQRAVTCQRLSNRKR